MNKIRPGLILMVLLFSMLLTCNVLAEDSLPSHTVSQVNPLYSEYGFSEEQEAPMLLAEEGEAPPYEEYATDFDAIEAQLLHGMVERKGSITLYYASDTYLAKEDMSALFFATFEDSEKPNEGDYLRWSWRKYNATFGGNRMNGINYYTITFTISYYTTLEEENIVANIIDQTLDSFHFQQGDSDYVKIKKVYDFICANVTYDQAGFQTLVDSDDTNNDYTAVTAHKALTKGTAVCQGYATLFYRMIKTLGIDVRVIAGTSRNQSHAWNIVKLGDYYYNLDSTWDAGKATYQYFLRSPYHFASQHTRNDEYTTLSYHIKHSMGGDYSCLVSGHEMNSNVKNATCTECGYAEYSCAACKYSYRSDYTASLEHDWDKGTVTKSVSATVPGEKTYTCSRCKEIKTEVIPATGPCKKDEACVSKGFSDAMDHWGHDSIDYVVSNGLMNGTGNGFEPDTTMSRAMLVTVLYRYAGKPEPGSSGFTDVPEDTWYTDAVSWAANNGVVTGTGDGSTFSPDVPVSREQLATILYRYAKSIGADTSSTSALSSYPDGESVAPWAADAVKWSVAKGLISGALRDGVSYLDPGVSANRAVVATIMMRFIQNVLE